MRVTTPHAGKPDASYNSQIHTLDTPCQETQIEVLDASYSQTHTLDTPCQGITNRGTGCEAVDTPCKGSQIQTLDTPCEALDARHWMRVTPHAVNTTFIYPCLSCHAPCFFSDCMLPNSSPNQMLSHAWKLWSAMLLLLWSINAMDVVPMKFICSSVSGHGLESAASISVWLPFNSPSQMLSHSWKLPASNMTWTVCFTTDVSSTLDSTMRCKRLFEQSAQSIYCC